MRRVTTGRDALLIYAAAFLRSTTVGLVGVIVAIYLGELGLSLGSIGVVIGAGMCGGAVATMLVSVGGDVVGRRRLLMMLAGLSALGYGALSISASLFILMPLAFCGTLNAMGRDRGAASALEQAILPETTTPERRTWALAWYNLILDGGHAVGALAGATPALLASWLHVDPVGAHRLTLWMCAAAVASSAGLYAALSSAVEVPSPSGLRETPTRLASDSRRAVAKLAVLFGLDSIGGGFLSSALIAYWFFQRYGLSERELAVLFFTARVLNAASHLGAAWLARRIGLVNTMVLTHLPSSLFLMAAPAAASPGLAAGLFLARESLVEMDVPTRQSYVMAIVRPSERTFASGVTNLTRNVGWALGPSLAGLVMQHVVLAGPLLVGGALKVAYDLMLYRSFRHLKAPEEQGDGV